METMQEWGRFYGIEEDKDMPDKAVYMGLFMYDIKEFLENHGSKWFSPNTVKFFKSRTYDVLGPFFIESVRADGFPREYRVCWAIEYSPSYVDVQHTKDMGSLSNARKALKEIYHMYNKAN